MPPGAVAVACLFFLACASAVWQVYFKKGKITKELFAFQSVC